MLAGILFPPWILMLSFLERQTMKPAGPPPVFTEAAVVTQAASKLSWWRKIYVRAPRVLCVGGWVGLCACACACVWI
jgi:hypothetical protein